MKIIGISGYAGSGKTTLANAIREELFNSLHPDVVRGMDVRILPFAEEVKRLAHEVFRIPASLPKEAYVPSMCMTVREVYQWFGTKVCRERDPNIWVKHWVDKIDKERPKIVIADDVRFANEAEKIRSMGGYIIRLKDWNPCNAHEKACELSNSCECDMVFTARLKSPEEYAKIVLREMETKC